MEHTHVSMIKNVPENCKFVFIGLCLLDCDQLIGFVIDLAIFAIFKVALSVKLDIIKPCEGCFGKDWSLSFNCVG